MSSKHLITVVGPTAIGKTALAIALARKWDTEILSSDSRQFFKEMTIGTAVPDSEELAAAKHHFIQHISIHTPYSVGDFERDALRLLDDLFREHDTVIMAGGSGLYNDALIHGIDTFPEVAPEIREQLNKTLQEEGISPLQEKLKALDPEHAENIDVHNPHRLIRALEICIGTGKPYSSFLNKPKPKRSFKAIKVGLTADRKLIYDRIDRRVDKMMAGGLLEEARALYPYKNLNALQTVGYRELFDHFDDKITLEEAVEIIKRNTRRFAKRQLTWYRKDQSILWFEYDTDPEVIFQTIQKKMVEDDEG